MKTVFPIAHERPQGISSEAFTLLELLVVLGVIAILIVVRLPALAGAKSQTKIGLCASNVRQIALACQFYASDNGERLPILFGAAASAWDLPGGLLSGNTEKKTYYCPGTAPRFTDKENWSGSGFGPNSTLWNYDSSFQFHIVGYALAFSGSTSRLASTNQNTTIQPERITDSVSGTSNIFSAAERVLVADATISFGATLPGYAHPENNYVSIPGGFTQNGVTYPHISPHLKGAVPIGGNLGFKDGHVAWRKFELMTPRTTSGATFWW